MTASASVHPGADTTPRRILLVDADAFFVAVARMEDPEGAGRAPLLVVGGRPGGRGVVCSASYEARQYGVRSAMPIARAERLCPHAMFVPVPRGACTRKSREIATVLARLAPVVQAASIDEWYLDLTGTEALYGHAPLHDVAHRIRDAVRDATGLSVSLGGGTNKLIAKLAVEFAKPKPGTTGDGVHVVPPGQESSFMLQVAIGDIPGVGPRLRDRLLAMGLGDVAAVRAAGRPALERLLGERAAHWLHDRVRGIGSTDVHPREQPKSVSHEETFGRDLHDDVDLERELVRLVTRVATDVRRKALAARTVTVKLKDADFRLRGASRTLDEPVVSDRVILLVARELLHKLLRARQVPARLLGVALSGLTDGEEEAQLSLFDNAGETAGPGGTSATAGSRRQPLGAPAAGAVRETPRDRALANAVDALRARFGADAIVPGRLAGPAPNAARAVADRPPGPAPGARRSGRSGRG